MCHLNIRLSELKKGVAVFARNETDVDVVSKAIPVLTSKPRAHSEHRDIFTRTGR